MESAAAGIAGLLGVRGGGSPTRGARAGRLHLGGEGGQEEPLPGAAIGGGGYAGDLDEPAVHGGNKAFEERGHVPTTAGERAQ